MLNRGSPVRLSPFLKCVDVRSFVMIIHIQKKTRWEQGARKAYEGAHKMSVMVSGANTPPTLDIKALADRPPTSADELRARYNASK